jgi:hypothetical protein
MSLQQLLQNNYVIAHQATLAEVGSLLGVVDRELSDATATGLSADGKFTHAYDAGLLLCKLSLHVCGFELAKGKKDHHALWIDSLKFTLGETHKDVSIHLSQSSTQRHHSMYDRSGVVEQADADELLEAARQLREDVLKWLRANHAKLLPKGY